MQIETTEITLEARGSGRVGERDRDPWGRLGERGERGRRKLRKGREGKNVGRFERWVSGSAGAGLVAMGAKALFHRKWSGVLAAGLGAGLLQRGITGHCFAYEALGMDTAQASEKATGCAERCVTIRRSPEDLYRYWRNLENLPRILEHIKSVNVTSGRESDWVAHGLFKKDLEWTAEIIEDRENEVIRWRSVPGGDVETSGSVRFEPLGHDRGTVVTASIEYRPASSTLARAVKLLRKGVEKRLADDLRHFKQAMEAGEIPTIDGQPSGRGRDHDNQPHPSRFRREESSEKSDEPQPVAGESSESPQTTAGEGGAS